MNFVFYYLATFFWLVSVATCDQPEGRIVGGEEVTPGDYQWFTTPINLCGGSLIHKDIVLTAAHCLHVDPSNTNYIDNFSNCTSVYTNIVNSPYCSDGCFFTGDEITNTFTDLIVFQNYGVNNNFESDIAILKLGTAVPDSITPVSYNTDNNIPAVGDILRTIGIGRTSDGGNFANDLLQVDVTAVDQDVCSSEWFTEITSDKLCAEDFGKDSCQGDSGGPLFVDGATQIQVGIVSYGIGCADSTRPPPVYTRVSNFASFIEQSICCLSSDPPSSCADTTTCPSEGVKGTCGTPFILRDGSDPTPVTAPNPAPVTAPNPAPVTAPNPAPVTAPNPAPVFAPNPAPVFAPNSAPTQSSTEEEGFCFSLTTRVWLRDNGMKYIRDVKIGDFVLTSSGEYKMVYTIEHLAEGTGTTMMKLYIDNIEEPALELTPSHMVYTGMNRNNPVPVKMLKIGDILQTINGPRELTKIEKSNDVDGYINILTIDGTIVVGSEGIIASNYADHWGISADYIHGATKPLMLLCTQISSKVCELPAKASNHERKIFYSWFGKNLISILDPTIIILTTAFLRQAYLLNYIFWIGFSFHFGHLSKKYFFKGLLEKN